MKQRPLFRSEVLGKKVNTHYDTVCINLPVKYQVVTIGMGGFTAILIIFIMMAEVSEKYTVQGYINTNQGIVSVYPKKPGVILKQNIFAGAKVQKGDVLYIIDTSDPAADQNHDQDIQNNLVAQQEIINHEIKIKQKKVDVFKQLLKQHYIALNAYNQVCQELLEEKNKKKNIANHQKVKNF